MKIQIELPEYDGNSLDVIWEEGGKYTVQEQNGTVILSANKEALTSFAKQLLYMAQEDIPGGCHVHLDSFFTGIEGQGLVIEKQV